MRKIHNTFQVHLILSFLAFMMAAVFSSCNEEEEMTASTSTLLETNTLNFSVSNAIQKIEVNAIGAWQLIIPEEDHYWLNATPQSGTGKTTVTFTASAFNNTDKTTTVLFMNGSLSIPLIVTQQGMNATTNLYTEDFGNTHEEATPVTDFSDWNPAGTGAAEVTYSGNATVISTSASEGYTGASASNHIYFETDQSEFIISNIKIAQAGALTLSFGSGYTSATPEMPYNSEDFIVSVSSDGAHYTPLNYFRKAGKSWSVVTVNLSSEHIQPGSSDLYIKFTAQTGGLFHLDDVKLFTKEYGAIPVVLQPVISAVEDTSVVITAGWENYDDVPVSEQGFKLREKEAIDWKMFPATAEENGSFSLAIQGLKPVTDYVACSYVRKAGKTYLGSEVSFTTYRTFIPQSAFVQFFDNFNTAQEGERYETGNYSGSEVHWYLEENSRLANWTGHIQAKDTFVTAYGDQEAWLITPPLDIAGAAFKYCYFQIYQENATGEELTVYASSDYAGKGDQAHWTPISLPNQSTNQQWTYSGIVDLSAYEGTVYVAFHYQGSAANTRVGLDDFKFGIEPKRMTAENIPTLKDIVADGGNYSFNIRSYTHWTVTTTNTDMITAFTPASGENDGQVTFTIAKNEDLARSGEIIITGNDVETIRIPVNQAGAPPKQLDVDVTAFPNVSATETTLTFNITSATSWEIATDNAAMVTNISPASGSNNQQVTVTVSANATSTSRNATLTITGVKAITQTITIHQKAAETFEGIWNMDNIPTEGGLSWGESPREISTNSNPNISISGLTKHGFLKQTGEKCFSTKCWGDNDFTKNTEANRLTAPVKSATFTLTAQERFSLSELRIFSRLNKDGTGAAPSNLSVQYQIGAGEYKEAILIDYEPFGTFANNVYGNVIDLSTVKDLQNIPASSVVTIRLVPIGNGAWTITNAYAKNEWAKKNLVISGTVEKD